MANKLYIISTESQSGKSVITLGLMQLLLGHIRKVAFFRPVINEEKDGQKDHHTNLILSHFNLNIPYEDTHACTFNEARLLMTGQNPSLLIDKIIQRYNEIEEKYDFILCEGTDYLGKNITFEFELNIEIAANLNTPIALIINGNNKSLEEIVTSAVSSVDVILEKTSEIACIFVNRVTLSQEERLLCESAIASRIDPQIPIIILPEDPLLGNPTMEDIKDWMDATIICGEASLHTQIKDYIIAAMNPGNFLSYIKDGTLVVTPGDRSDLILASFAARLSTAYQNIGGILLTGGITPHDNILRLINGWAATPISILSVKEDTYTSILMLSELNGKIVPSDSRKINTALCLFEQYTNSETMLERIVDRTSNKVSPKMFEFKLIKQAQQNKMRIVLPESTEERILKASEILVKRGVADIILLGDHNDIECAASKFGVSLKDIQVMNIDTNSALFESYVEEYYTLRKHKGITMDEAQDLMHDSTYFATMMVHKNDADGMVSGSINTTAHTIRPAFEIIRTTAGASIISSVFLMCMRDHVLVFGDCAVNPNPTAEQLADIAISSAHTAKIFGITPRVAMLSYSTGSSGKGVDVDIVTQATEIAQKKAPDLILDGPIQYDAAVDPSVAKAKAPKSTVAGQATVFIFPDLNTGNNTYKAVQRAADAVAIGPILQGLNKPVNDLSRGCTITDIINTVAITAIQAQGIQK